MFLVTREDAAKDYRRYATIANDGFVVLMSALAQSPLVQTKWRNMPKSRFLLWAAAANGLSLGIPSAKYLDQRLAEMLA